MTIEQRFGVHKGLDTHAKPNSLKAIQEAIDLKPVFVEFDVMSINGIIKTGHPPQEPLDKLEDVLSLFEGHETYPKIDIKLKNNGLYSVVTDKVLELVNQASIDFTLINMDGKEGSYQAKAENYFFAKVRNNPEIKLNIDLARYRKPGCRIDSIKKHVKGLGSIIYSVSPEIHEENWDEVLRFAEKHHIKNCCFWLRNHSGAFNPKVTVETIRKALSLEKEYDVKIYFQINLNYIKGIFLK